MKICLTSFILILSILGCSKTQPEAKIEKKAVEVPTLVRTIKSESSVEVNTAFNAQNITLEDKYTKVFRNCFKTGKVRLEASCKKQIDNFLAEISLKNKRNIIIQVHTDKGGSVKKNLDISIKRAQKIASSFYYKEYKYSKVYYQGFGESKLIYDEQTQKSDIKNRRVVIRLRPKDFKVDKKSYTHFVKKINKKPSKKSSKRESLSILAFTGKADTGWIYFGKPSLAKKFTMSCAQGNPLKIKRKALSRADENEFISNFYNRKISMSFKDNELEVSPIYIYENGKLPISNPILTLKEKQKNIVRFQTTVNTYRGKKGILYRVFVNGKKSVKCLDLVISYKDEKIFYGNVYMQNGEVFKLREKD